ncbi:hypothetical protein TNCT_671901 [Trichonephila clavata]|uniref:Uncharacterized protein n=1 Tax=Trichonephila clavata TaxID=2740835 RepID=A0A8X6I162_TRICU|nr:hypothetical protein TNCT_671901 [Trichonephila clavata]
MFLPWPTICSLIGVSNAQIFTYLQLTEGHIICHGSVERVTKAPGQEPFAERTCDDLLPGLDWIRGQSGRHFHAAFFEPGRTED